MSRSSDLDLIWTKEDSDILWRLLLRFHGRCAIWYEAQLSSRDQDRRDAELMFEGQRIRSYTFPVDMPPIAWMLPGGPVVDLGGALQEWRTLNISYFA